MDAGTLLAELKGRGARIELLPDDRFAVEPASLIDRQLRDSLRSHEDEILVALRRATDDDLGLSPGLAGVLLPSLTSQRVGNCSQRKKVRLEWSKLTALSISLNLTLRIVCERHKGAGCPTATNLRARPLASTASSLPARYSPSAW